MAIAGLKIYPPSAN